MSSIKIILSKDVNTLGEEGDVKVVKKGYARNYLFPKKLAVDYSLANQKMLDSKKEYLEKRKGQKKEDALKLKEQIEKEKITIEVTSGDKGRLYGTVTTVNIAEELHKLNYDIDKKKIELKEHIKFGGSYKFYVHLYLDVNAVVDLVVVAKQEQKQQDRKVKGKRGGYKNTHRDEENPVEEVESKEDKSEEISE
jgi:large subunit ribosomal protein L9